jgi:Putative bacterial sensory transduction regulator
MSKQSQLAADVVRDVLSEHDVEVEEPELGHFVVTLPGTRKQKTTCSLVVGEHALTVQAFVARHVDENAEAVYRWLLERNLRMYGVAFAIDHLGDIYLAGRLPLASIDEAEVDRILGSVLEYADGSFNTILELGFASAIRREWEWRISRGESTANLEAFKHLALPAD